MNIQHRTFNRLNIEHRTSNVEHRIMMSLRSSILFHFFKIQYQTLNAYFFCFVIFFLNCHSLFKIGFFIQHSMLDVRCSMFIFFIKHSTIFRLKNNLAFMRVHPHPGPKPNKNPGPEDHVLLYSERICFIESSLTF